MLWGPSVQLIDSGAEARDISVLIILKSIVSMLTTNHRFIHSQQPKPVQIAKNAGKEIYVRRRIMTKFANIRMNRTGIRVLYFLVSPTLTMMTWIFIELAQDFEMRIEAFLFLLLFYAMASSTVYCLCGRYLNQEMDECSHPTSGALLWLKWHLHVELPLKKGQLWFLWDKAQRNLINCDEKRRRPKSSIFDKLGYDVKILMTNRRFSRNRHDLRRNTIKAEPVSPNQDGFADDPGPKSMSWWLAASGQSFAEWS